MSDYCCGDYRIIEYPLDDSQEPELHHPTPGTLKHHSAPSHPLGGLGD
jgi:hypothetical protein